MALGLEGMVLIIAGYISEVQGFLGRDPDGAASGLMGWRRRSDLSDAVKPVLHKLLDRVMLLRLKYASLHRGRADDLEYGNLKEKNHVLSDYCGVGTARYHKILQDGPGKEPATVTIGMDIYDSQHIHQRGGTTANDGISKPRQG